MAQFGWNLNLSRCVGCKACAVSCLAENNTSPATTGATAALQEQLVVRNALPVIVQYRDVLHVDSGTYPTPTRTFVTMACNHCADPACMAACPVGAISKLAADHATAPGVVLIDHSLCIGCRYCEAVCPWGAPQFNENTGKAEKCSACMHRLAVGLEPACVTTCVGKALTWVDDFTTTSGTPPEGFSDPALTNASIKFV